MVIMGLGALAVYTGTIDSPFDQPIQSPEPATVTMPPPCVPQNEEYPDGTPPMPYDELEVAVYNAANYSFAIAGANADVLGERGIATTDTGDFAPLIDGPSQIRYGREGIRAAYTLAAQYQDIDLILDDREGSSIDLLIGAEYEEPLPEEEVSLTSGEPMQDLPECVPVDRLTPIPREYAEGRSPEPTEGEDAESEHA